MGEWKGRPVGLEDYKRISESQKLRKSRVNHWLSTVKILAHQKLRNWIEHCKGKKNCCSRKHNNRNGKKCVSNTVALSSLFACSANSFKYDEICRFFQQKIQLLLWHASLWNLRWKGRIVCREFRVGKIKWISLLVISVILESSAK